MFRELFAARFVDGRFTKRFLHEIVVRRYRYDIISNRFEHRRMAREIFAAAATCTNVRRMNQAKDTSPHDETTDADWDRLAQHIEAFLEQWETDGFGPQIADHLPQEPASLRRLALIELIKVDLEQRYSSDGPVLRLEDYLEENPELNAQGGMPTDLIYEEFHIRQATGETIVTEEWLKRFPEQAAEVRKLLQLDDTGEKSKTGTDVSEAYRPGDHIGDFYLMSALGTGAFGSVFLARQESMQRMVALKVSCDKGTEAQTLAQLDHPNIVRVYDQVRLPEEDLRLLYMQFAAGGTLQAVVRASRKAKHKSGRVVEQCIADALDHSGVLSSENVSLKGGLADKSWPEVVCQLGMELAQALHYAHEQNILHRDVKPANVLLAANGTAKLADFNISFSAEVEGDSAEASFGGSLAYMSPEQLEACNPTQETNPSDLDARSDVFSLGILLWELMYGARPFDDESVTGGWTESLRAMTRLRRDGVGNAPVNPTTAAEEQLHSILQRCLAPNPRLRFQTASELAHQLGLCLQPRVAQLMHKSKRGWRRKAVLWPLCAFLLASIGPHVLAAVFNFQYNDKEIIHEFTVVQDMKNVADKFRMIVIAINLIAFPVGFWFCIRYSKPVVQVLRDGVSEATAGTVAAARRRAFQLSRFVTILGITEWLIAGLAYPIVLRALAGGLAPWWYAHFIASLLICGLIAAAYPFFMTAALTIRSFLPALLQNDRLNRDDVVELQRLSEQSAWSLYLAGGVPAAGILILLITQEKENSNSGLALMLLSVAGAVGFAAVLGLAKSLQSDIEALQEASRLTQETPS